MPASPRDEPSEAGAPGAAQAPAPFPSRGAQVLGSLLAAFAIAAVAVAVVTARFGPTSSAERELQEQRIEQREEALEERRDLFEERRELLEERLEQSR